MTVIRYNTLTTAKFTAC